MQRPIIEIDEEKCNGCGQCILDCAEGALAIVNGKARLISDVYCDGLGACLNCPQGALSLRTREAPAFDEAAALQAKLEREQGGNSLTPPAGSQPMREILATASREDFLRKGLKSRLQSWPIQLQLMPPRADYYANADILLAAQCSGFALPQLSEDWLKGRLPIIACPKLEDNGLLIQKLAAILKNNHVGKLTALRMSVPCCGLERIVRAALEQSGKDIPWDIHVAQLL